MMVTESKIKKVLMIARAFPPFLPVGHSIRAVKFAKFLPALGWLPVILTIDDQMEYESTRKVGSETLLSEIQPQVRIYRTATGEPSLKFLEMENKFSQRNRLTRLIVKILGGTRRWALRTVFLPDRYLAWLPFALRQGQQIVRRDGIDIIFATCPPHSVALIGAFLKLLTGKPLILDFRDNWVGTPWHYSRPIIIRMVERWLEHLMVRISDKVILVTEWSERSFHERYPEEPRDKFVLIPNGCDLEEFTILKPMGTEPRNPKFTIVHAGSLYSSKNLERSPTAFFQAVRQLVNKHTDVIDKMTLLFIGEFPEEFRQLAEELGLSVMIKELGYLPHDQVLRLMKSADLLLTIATERYSTAIPGKIYEYWAIGGPPIMLLSYPGAAKNLVERYDLGFTIEPSDIDGIEQAIWKTYLNNHDGTPLRIKTSGIETFDRKALTYSLAKVLSLVNDR